MERRRGGREGRGEIEEGETDRQGHGKDKSRRRGCVTGAER